MTSQALLVLDQRIAEVRALQSLDPTPPNALPTSQLDRIASEAVIRASIVLLCAHLEGYVEDLFLESLDFLSGARLEHRWVPLALKFQHARKPVEDLALIRDPEKFVAAYVRLTKTNSPLFSGQRLAPGCLETERLRASFASPTPTKIASLFAVLGLAKKDVLTGCFPSSRIAALVNRSLASLVEVRGAIAHGEMSSSATQRDVSRYSSAVRFFGARLDLAVALQLGELSRGPHPGRAVGLGRRATSAA
jgi:hypothetical protein